jgi:hypothetical protein
VVAGELDTLCTRLVHLVAAEGYGHGYGLARGLRRTWSSTPVPSIVVCRTTARLRALGREEVEQVLATTAARADLVPEVRALLVAEAGEPPWPDPLGAGFAETILDEGAEVTARRAQWVRRIRYLVREEGLSGDKVRALLFSEAAHRLLRHLAPGPSGYLIDAALTSETPEERSAWLSLLRHRYATIVGSSDSDETVIRKVGDRLEGYSGESDGLAAEVVDRLIERGLLPAGFSAPGRERE